MAAISAWLDGSGRTFWLEGPPGTGKSVIAAMVGDSYPQSEGEGPLVVVHACKASDITSITPRSFVEKISAALAGWEPFARALFASSPGREINISVTQNIGSAQQVTGIAIERVVIGDLEPQDAFVRAVLNPLTAALRDTPRSILLVVDGLDESLIPDRGPDIGQLISALDGAPPEVRLLVTSRPDTRLRASFGDALVWRLNAGPALAAADQELSAFVSADLTRSPEILSRLAPNLNEERLTALIAEAARGNFLIARLLLDMLSVDEAIITEQSIRAAPLGLHGLYRSNLARLERRVGHATWRSQRLPILGCLAVALEPLTERELAAMCGLAPDLTRAALEDLRQLLVADVDAPASQRRYALYHNSFVEFLLNTDAAEENWCSEPDQHRRIAEVLRGEPPWANFEWRSAEPYLLRHMAAHVAAQGPNGITDLETLLLGPFLRAQYNLAGPIFALQSLRTGIRAAGNARDLGRLFCFTWVYAALRDLITQSVSPAIIELYAKLGDVDRALGLIENAEDPYRLSRQTLVAALARAGRLDEALRLAAPNAEPLEPEMAMAIARALAEKAPARALEIAPQAGIGFWRDEIALCVALARRAEFVETAVERAKHCAEAMLPVALEVAKRDWRRSLGLMEGVSEHKELVDGVQFYRTRESGIAELAVQLSRSGDAETAVGLLSRLKRRDDDLGIAATVMAGELSRADFHHAKACLDIASGVHPLYGLLVIANVLAFDASGLTEPAQQLLAGDRDKLILPRRTRSSGKLWRLCSASIQSEKVSTCYVGWI
jgi:hypothetical protein